MGFRGSGFRGLGLGAWDLEVRVWGLKVWASSLASGVGLRVWSLKSRLRAWDLGCDTACRPLFRFRMWVPCVPLMRPSGHSTI